MSESESGDIPDDSSSSTGELFPIEDVVMSDAVFDYSDHNLFSSTTSAVLGNDLEMLQELVQQGRSLRIIDNNGNTLLHLAVMSPGGPDKNLINYLISHEEVDKNATNFLGQTPLLMCTKMRKEAAAYMLIEGGVDIHIPSDLYETPLHFSIRFSTKLSETLILAGADPDFQDYNGDTPLHDVIPYGEIETLCMLLYYGADTSVQNSGKLTPFMQSLALNKQEHADHLFEYVSNFNLKTDVGMSTLWLGLTIQYPRTIEMIERGADVNTKTNGYNVFTINSGMSIEVFKYIWDRFDYATVWNKTLQNILIYILTNFNTTTDYKVEAIKFILEGENTESINCLVNDSQYYPIIYHLVNKLFLMQAPEKLVHAFCAILLSFNLIVYNCDLDLVYERYGYSDLFKLLLHMELRSAQFNLFNILPTLIYTTQENYEFYEILKELLRSKYSQIQRGINIYERFDFENIFDHLSFSHIKSPLRHALLPEEDSPDNIQLLQFIQSLPHVPKLLELARNKSRDFICDNYKIKNCCQFYTILKSLDIPSRIKQYIAFEVPIYRKDKEFDDFRIKFKASRNMKVNFIHILDNNFPDFI